MQLEWKNGNGPAHNVTEGSPDEVDPVGMRLNEAQVLLYVHRAGLTGPEKSEFKTIATTPHSL